MPYFSHADLAALIPADFLLQALDDDNDGVEDAFEAVRTSAQETVDAYLGARYTVPLTTEPLPKLVVQAAIAFAAELCYQRRGTPKENNPWYDRAESMRKLLTAVAKGEIQLQVSAPAPAQPPGSIVVFDSLLGTPGRPLA
ncbi:MAG: phage protein Gp36 family protein [Verrucomicrobiaceae bacterium]